MARTTPPYSPTFVAILLIGWLVLGVGLLIFIGSAIAFDWNQAIASGRQAFIFPILYPSAGAIVFGLLLTGFGHMGQIMLRLEWQLERMANRQLPNGGIDDRKSPLRSSGFEE